MNSIVGGALQVVYAAISRRFNSGSALCGTTTRDYTFITANFLYCGMPPPPALYRMWRRLNCFWLIKGPKYHSTASKPGANRLEAPVNSPNSQSLPHTRRPPYRRLYRFVYNAALTDSVFCLNAPKYRRYAENRSQ